MRKSLGDSPEWNTVIDYAKEEYNLQSAEALTAPVFLRKHVFELTVKTLDLPMKSGKGKFIDNTNRFDNVKKNVFKDKFKSKVAKAVVEPKDEVALDTVFSDILIATNFNFTENGSYDYEGQSYSYTNYNSVQL